MIFPSSVTGQAGEIGCKIRTTTLSTSEGIASIVFLAVVFAPESKYTYLQGGRQEATSKSFLRTNQYIPHSYGREGTNIKRLQGHF